MNIIFILLRMSPSRKFLFWGISGHSPNVDEFNVINKVCDAIFSIKLYGYAAMPY
jgi:hypothetical protein